MISLANALRTGWTVTLLSCSFSCSFYGVSTPDDVHRINLENGFSLHYAALDKQTGSVFIELADISGKADMRGVQVSLTPFTVGQAKALDPRFESPEGSSSYKDGVLNEVSYREALKLIELINAKSSEFRYRLPSHLELDVFYCCFMYPLYSGFFEGPILYWFFSEFVQCSDPDPNNIQVLGVGRFWGPEQSGVNQYLEDLPADSGHYAVGFRLVRERKQHSDG